jgi:hypothetical protein
MTLETLIADAVERGVLAAMSKLNAGQHLTADATTVAEVIVSVPPVTKKPGRPKKSDAQNDAAPVVTDTPLPPPAPAPATVVVDDIESDRAKLIALTSKIENGRKLATELIRKHGPKFDALAPDIRAEILAELASMVPA